MNGIFIECGLPVHFDSIDFQFNFQSIMNKNQRIENRRSQICVQKKTFWSGCSYKIITFVRVSINGIIMDSKLTLKLNENVIERAKKYASSKKLSLSRLIENYLDSLTQEKEDEFEISPFVKSISSGKSIPADFDYKKEHVEYLDKKHQ